MWSPTDNGHNGAGRTHIKEHNVQCTRVEGRLPEQSIVQTHWGRERERVMRRNLVIIAGWVFTVVIQKPNYQQKNCSCIYMLYNRPCIQTFLSLVPKLLTLSYQTQVLKNGCKIYIFSPSNLSHFQTLLGLNILWTTCHGNWMQQRVTNTKSLFCFTHENYFV